MKRFRYTLAGMLAAVSLSAVAFIGGGVIVHNHSSNSQGGSNLTLTQPVYRSYPIGASTWTKPANLKRLEVHVVGGGGAGGGAIVGNGAGGTGGGGGGHCYAVYLAAHLTSSEQVTVAAQVAGDADAGSNGNTSSFSAGNTLCSASGGLGGAAGHSGAPTAGGAAGFAVGPATSLFSMVHEGGEGHGTANDTASWMGGAGGASGSGHPGAAPGITAGKDPNTCGGGGSGARSGATNNGGNGNNGCVWLIEHFI